MTNKLPLSVERIIRSEFKTSSAGIRAKVRQAVKANNLDALRTAAHYLPGLAPAYQAVIAEVERILADRAKTKARNEELREAIANGCPCCGAKMKRNLSLTGWWQCSQFGADGFRADNSKPACNFQGFLVEEES